MKVMLALVAVVVVLALGQGAVLAMAGGCTTTQTVGDYVSGQIKHAWQVREATVCVTFAKAGKVSITSGYVFDRAEMTLNSTATSLATYRKSGEQAPQLSPFHFDVTAGQVVTFKATADAPHLAELGLWFTYEPFAPKVYTLYVPLVVKAPQPPATLEKSYALDRLSQLQIKSQGWPEAVANQQACLNLAFNGAGLVKIESGWFIGDVVTGSVDGTAIFIPFRQTAELAKQIDSFSFQAANGQTLRVCANGASAGREIGLRVRF